jgi:hypothetical protein
MSRQLKYYYPKIVEICKGIAVNYEDLAHDVYLKLYEDDKFLTASNKPGYIYIVARNHYRNQLNKDRTCELIYSPADSKEDLKPDPFMIYEKINEFQKHNEILGIVLELYYQFEGNISSIERNMKGMGFSLTRQTLANYYKEAQKEFEKWIG